MPDKILVFNIIGVILQYGFVAMIYLFLLKIIKVVYKDLRAPETERNFFNKETQAEARVNLVESGHFKFKQRTFKINEMLLIGRASTNDIAIDDTFVSYEHACIAKDHEQYLITDLNSTNGTFLNGKRLLEEKMLTSGDLIKIGPAVFKFER